VPRQGANTQPPTLTRIMALFLTSGATIEEQDLFPNGNGEHMGG